MTLNRKYEDRMLLEERRNEDVIQSGSLRKLKSLKMKFVMLRTSSENGKARMEFYASERKYRDGSKASRAIFITDILNVEKTQHPEHHFVFTVFVKSEKLVFVAKFPDERDSWIDAINFLKRQLETNPQNNDFVWDVTIKDYGIAKGTAMSGERRLKKCSNTLTILKKNSEDPLQLFSLSNIKRSGFSNRFVLLEIGRSHVIGPGELWIEADDARSAEDIYTVLFGCNFVRPKTCVGVDREHLMSQKMTVRRRSDGAEKGKIRKKSSLFPFLKSKNKQKDQPHDTKPSALQSRRSHSASDLHKIGENLDGDIQKLLLKHQTSSPTSNSVCDVKQASTSTKKTRRLSWFRDKKNDVSASLQNINIAEAELRGSLPNQVSKLKAQYEKDISRSAQNIDSMGRVSPLVNQTHSSRLSNIRNLSMLQSHSATDVRNPSKSNDEFLRRNAGKTTRPSTMAFSNTETAAVLRKTKWKSVDHDSPGVSSEECSSIGSVDSNYSLDSLPPRGDSAANSCDNISDEGYVRMNYNCDNAKPRNLKDSNRNNIYMLIKPDETALYEAAGGEETYMNMMDVESNDMECAERASTDEDHAPHESEAMPNEALYCQGNKQPSLGQSESPDEILSKQRRRPPPVPDTSRYSISSNESSVFSSSVSETPSPTKASRPVPLPPRSRRELSYPSTSSNDQSSSVEDRNPIPLPPKVNRQFSHQSSVSDEERAGRISPKNRLCESSHVTSSDSEGPVLPPPRRSRRFSKDNCPSDEEKPTPVVAKNLAGRPLPTPPRNGDAKQTEEANIVGRKLPPTPKSENVPEKSTGDDEALMRMYATVNKAHKGLSHQNSAPIPPKYQREVSQQSSKSEGGISPMRIRRPLSPPAHRHKGLEKTRDQRSFSDMSPSEYEDIATAVATEKKSKALWKDISKRMTVNFRQNKKLTLSPKRRVSEATSHFYVDTCPVVNVDKEKESNKQTNDVKAEHSLPECHDNVGIEQLRKPLDLPVRPNYLDLSKSSRYETVDFDKGNIYLSIADNETDDDSNDPESVRKLAESGRNLQEAEQRSKASKNTANTKHIQQEKTGRTQNYERVYTEVTLKEKENPNMPLKGFRSLAREKKSKGKGALEAVETIIPSQADATDENQFIQQGKPTQKILSSPTKSGKGYENISLRDEVITTPLDEIEGRPYMNLGFHKSKGKGGGEKRRSADDAAMKLLMNLQNEKKIGDELSVRRKSNADRMGRKGSCDLEDTEEEDEASYVNIGKDRKLIDNSGCNISQGIAGGRNRRTSGEMNAEDDSTYQNIAISANAKKSQDINQPVDSTAHADDKHVGNRPKTRENPDFKQESNDGHLYSNIGFGDGRDTNQSDGKRPLPKPRPKKPERRKISQTPTKGAHKSPDSNPNSSGAPYDEVSFSPKYGYMTNGVPNVLAEFGISESSYVNVGSSGYHDDFDVGGVPQAPPIIPKGQNYENMAEEFQPRRNRKKSADWDLAYADVTLVRGKEQTEEVWYSDEAQYAELAVPGKTGASPDNSKKNSPKTNLKEPSRSRCAYTEIDFMKSHGITEAVRERRVESFDGTD